jgi:antirestriction protein ArdC
MKNNSTQEIRWTELLHEAVSKPGTVMKAYSLFWNYSLGNQILALIQAAERGLTLGPIASYNKWRELGRQVRRGEKAIVLCRPVTLKRKSSEKDAEGEEHETETTFTRFVFKPYWFFIGQTEGQEYKAPSVPSWDRTRALNALNVEEIPFEMLNGNCQGYAKGRQVAINPLAQLPVKTLFHELAHIELGHTSEAVHDSETIPRSLREAEAECTALLCLEALGLEGAEYCRGYVQGWIGQSPIQERSAQKIFAAADRILKAGITAMTTGSENQI